MARRIEVDEQTYADLEDWAEENGLTVEELVEQLMTAIFTLLESFKLQTPKQ